MGNDNTDRNRHGQDPTPAGQKDKRGDSAGPPDGQGHQPLPGENPPADGHGKRKHVQNADLPEGEGHQPLPGEDAQTEDDDDRTDR
jgi:hypothetical protein